MSKESDIRKTLKKYKTIQSVISLSCYASAEDWEAVRSCCTDRKVFHSSYEVWKEDHELFLRLAKRERIDIKRVPLRPETFSAFCIAGGHKPDTQARALYAAADSAEAELLPWKTPTTSLP